ncbi:MAG TPA: DUF1697 domain-containing protein [Verrucomicrobiae bacterium]|nr:DUF1697 domain-containing protein [Verrucomicrobiae bacterium]
MRRYIAFLRGINVGGNRVVKMEVLRKLFEELGLEGVKTYIQSGNVFFDADADPQKLEAQIAPHLHTALGFQVPVYIRTVEEVDSLLEFPLFCDKEPGENERYLVLFTAEKVTVPKKLPLTSAKGDCEIVGVGKKEVFVRYFVTNGRPADPTKLVSVTFGDIQTTGRFFHTLKKIVTAAKA